MPRKTHSKRKSAAEKRRAASSARLAAQPRRKPRIARTALRGLNPRELGIKRKERAAAKRQVDALVGAQARRKPRQGLSKQREFALVDPRDPFDLCAKRRRAQGIRKGAILAAGKGGKGNLRKGVQKRTNPC